MSFGFGGDRARDRLLPTNDRDGDVLYIEDSRKIQDNIFALQCQTSAISHLCSGTKNLSVTQEEEQLHTKLQEAQKIAAETQALLKQLGEVYGGSASEKNQRKLMHQKLALNFQQALKALDQVTQSYLLKNKRRKGQSVRSAAAQDIDSYPTRSMHNRCFESDSYMHSGELYPQTIDYSKESEHEEGQSQSSSSVRVPYQQSLDSVEYTSESNQLEKDLLHQRHAGITKIQKDILGLHEMYQDLAWHVNMQGDTIENIEMNLTQADEQTSNAVEEVRIATRRVRPSKIILVCMVLAVVTALILFLIIILKKH